MNQAVSSYKTEKKFENRLNPLFCKLILTASAKFSTSIPLEPNEEARTFFEQKNSTDAKSYLQHMLIVEKNLPIHIPAGLVTVIWLGVVFWDRQDNPSNFSFSLIPAQTASMISDTADNIALSLKASDSRGGIDSDDIRRLIRHHIFLLMQKKQYEHHLNHRMHVLCII